MKKNYKIILILILIVSLIASMFIQVENFENAKNAYIYSNYKKDDENKVKIVSFDVLAAPLLPDNQYKSNL